MEKITLGDFIESMKTGYGFWRSSRVRQIGNALDALFPADVREAPVTVEFVKSNNGYGAGSSTCYLWKVLGINLPEEGTLPESKADRIFGFKAGSLPELFNIGCGYTGFIASYES